MMRSRPLSKLRSYLLPAVAAILLAVGPMACSSSGEESPNPALDGAASGEETNSGNSASANTDSNAAAVNADTETANTNGASPEGGEAAASNNPIGNELNNAIANEGGAAPAGEGAVPENGGGLNTESGSGAELTGDAGSTNPVAGAVDANATNPFATPANGAGTPPANAMPADPAVPGDSATTGMAATPTEPVPADAGAAATGSATAPASAPAADAGAAPATGATGPTSLPEMGAKMAYYVMRGDTLGSIAQKIYGSRKKWKALQAENGLADANKIYPGDVLYFTLDESTKGFAEKYELGQRQAYTVARGDTLSRLAAKFYGTQGAWRALWKENPQILNPDRIRVGMVLSFRAVNKVAFKDERETEEEVLKAASLGNESRGDENGGLTQANSEETAGQFTAAAE